MKFSSKINLCNKQNYEISPKFDIVAGQGWSPKNDFLLKNHFTFRYLNQNSFKYVKKLWHPKAYWTYDVQYRCWRPPSRPKPPRSQTRRRTWTVAILDLHIHIDASIDFAIESSRCVDMSVQRLLGFFSDDRQIVNKSLPEVDQKSQKSDQNRHRFTSFSTLHYVASNLGMWCRFQ